MFSVAIEFGGAGCSRHYAPLPVTPGLRGHADDSLLQVPLQGKQVSITGLAASFCPTGRDIFLEKRLRVDTPSWERHVLGHVVDDLLVSLHRRGMELLEDGFEEAIGEGRRPDLDAIVVNITNAGVELADSILGAWSYDEHGKDPKFLGMDAEAFARALNPNQEPDVLDRTQAALRELARFEAQRLGEYLKKHRRIARFLWPEDWMGDVRATIARLQTGIHLDTKKADAQRFGLSENIRPDFLYAVTLIGDIKTGHYHAFYEDVATGYAIVGEYVFKRRINTAAILLIGLDLVAGRLRSHEIRLFRPDTSRRERWLTKRDLARRVLADKNAPKHPDDVTPCNQCPYRTHCWKDGKPGEGPTTPDPPPAGKTAGHGGAAEANPGETKEAP